MSKLGAFALGALAGALLVGFLAWRAGAGYRREITQLQTVSAARSDTSAIRAAERALLEASERRWQEQTAYWQAKAEARDTVPLPRPRPRPDPVIRPPDYAAAARELVKVVAERDSIWEDNRKLHAAVEWRDGQIASFANVTAGLRGQLADVRGQLAITKADLLSAQADRDAWREQAESAPVAQLPSFGLGDAADCAIGAAAGALVGHLVSDRSAVTLSAAGVGCVVNALR